MLKPLKRQLAILQGEKVSFELGGWSLLFFGFNKTSSILTAKPQSARGQRTRTNTRRDTNAEAPPDVKVPYSEWLSLLCCPFFHVQNKYRIRLAS